MRLRSLALVLAFLAASCADAPRLASSMASPPQAARQIAMSANPLATRAALDMLDRGGSAIDAAVAAQMVLGLVEPQSSGIGGGTLILHWEAAQRKLTAFDGLSAAPARATASLRTDVDGKLLPPMRYGGRTFGVPGTLAVLRMAHERYGKLPWADLFEPAIRLAESGFAMPHFLHGLLAAEPDAAREFPGIARIYFDADGRVLPVGTVIRNPDYAATMRRAARDGVPGWLAGGAADRIVAAAQGGAHPSLATAADLRGYRAAERDAMCAPFLVYVVCTAPPPSYGGLYVLQVLQMAEARAQGRFDLDDPEFVHLYLEAGKLAQADRRAYVGDPDFVDVPTDELSAPGYAEARSALIDAARANPDPKPGPLHTMTAARKPDAGDTFEGTSQMAIADAAGNVVAITTTVNLIFGARLMVDGFVLNDALTNFSAAPKPGETVANSMAPRKRPVTSMSPTIVFDATGMPVIAGGSAGGGPIVDYITVALIDMLANRRAPLEAISRGHVSTAARGKIELEKGTAAEELAPALRAKGHDVDIVPLRSGAGFIRRDASGWTGAADPRRDGSAEGK
ncbi:MAG: gamma-glutamyltransferase family protein [Usitatibacter sp.]